jgi:hypothetical protein
VGNGDWSPATPLDGSFDGPVERFSWRPPRGLPRSITSYEGQARCWDGSGEANEQNPTYRFYVIGEQPMIGILCNRLIIMNGDSIDHDSEFEITVISDHPPVAVRRAIRESKESQDDTIPLTVTAEAGNPYIFHATDRPNLVDGNYIYKVEAEDITSAKQVEEINQLQVRASSALALQKPPLAYPNPFNPDSGQNLYIGYELTRSANIILRIYNTFMEQVTRIEYPTGSNGGNAGYNEVIWDTKDNGREVGNGTYIFLLEGEGRILSLGRVTILKQ